MIAPRTAPDVIHGFAASLCEGFAALAPQALEEGERSRLGALLFRGAVRFVGGVAQAACAQPELFPEADGAALRARQARAAAWMEVAVHLERMLAEARDSYMYEQGMAVQEAMLVVQQMRHAAEAPGRGRPGPGDLPLQQAAALAAPLAVLEERRRKKRRAATQRRREEGRSLPQRRRRAQDKVAEALGEAMLTLQRRRAQGAAADPQTHEATAEPTRAVSASAAGLPWFLLSIAFLSMGQRNAAGAAAGAAAGDRAGEPGARSRPGVRHEEVVDHPGPGGGELRDVAPVPDRP